MSPRIGFSSELGVLGADPLSQSSSPRGTEGLPRTKFPLPGLGVEEVGIYPPNPRGEHGSLCKPMTTR